ncbi:unnamed protein product [Lactuca virosa]|uniref:Uncharacterized protein n=1 Tax=Lactuca virosa TaxID=75947 RepID=A0AAU9MB10_9ASTR|nr:unnamed protein product [Lactuca virosa]
MMGFGTSLTSPEGCRRRGGSPVNGWVVGNGVGRRCVERQWKPRTVGGRRSQRFLSKNENGTHTELGQNEGASSNSVFIQVLSFFCRLNFKIFMIGQLLAGLVGHKKRDHFDGESEYSGSFKLLDGGAYFSVFPSKPMVELKHVQSEIDMLEDHKQQLQCLVLFGGKDECKRFYFSYFKISSKIRKFVKANHRYSRIQDEPKRSQASL